MRDPHPFFSPPLLAHHYNTPDEDHKGGIRPVLGMIGDGFFGLVGGRQSAAFVFSSGGIVWRRALKGALLRCHNLLCRHGLRHFFSSANIWPLPKRAAIGRIPPSLEPFLTCRRIKSVPREPLGRAAVVKDDRLQQQGVLNVKKSRLMAVLATCAAGCLVWMSLAARPALAQQRPPMAAPAAPIGADRHQLAFSRNMRPSGPR